VTARGKIVILGGGLAGMSAAVSLAQSGYQITLVEKRAALGGRAGSHFDVASGEWIDNCQHILMPCCTSLLDFYRRIGVERNIRFHSTIPFIDSNRRVSRLRAGLLPAPFHCAPSFFRLRFLTLGEKLRIASGMVSLLRRNPADDFQATAEAWLLARRQGKRAIELFWQLVLVSALNETLDRASLGHAAKVFVEAFLSNPRGWWLGVPTVPLGALYGENLCRTLQQHEGSVRTRIRAEKVEVAQDNTLEVVVLGGERIRADKVIVALPWHAVCDVLPPVAAVSCAAVDGLSPSPITGIHLWFDRNVTDLEFAALPGRTIHWFFNKSRTHGLDREAGTYLQLITSASRDWMAWSKGNILEMALSELKEILPQVRSARVVRSFVLKEPAATFSPTAESERLRPGVETNVPRLFIAED
jgi:squalene-associated FAD-dependent desaturase